MRPKLGTLIHKIRNLKFLEEHPDSVPYFLQQIAYHYFVKTRQRPADAFKAFEYMYGVWQGAMGYPPYLHDEANDRQLEMAQNAVTGDELSEKLSLRQGHAEDCTVRKWPYAKCSCGFQERVEAEKAQVTTHSQASEKHAKRAGLRNNTSPGPSHKSPIAYKGNLGVGFTIPGIEGKFAWTGTEPRQKPPDMDKVIEILAEAELARGEARRSPEIDLTNKDLKRRVRQVLMLHTYFKTLSKKGGNITDCGCGQSFELIEEWAVHVRKAIWKELKNEAV